MVEGGEAQVQPCDVDLDFSLMEAGGEWSQHAVLVTCYVMMVRHTAATQYRVPTACGLVHAWAVLEASILCLSVDTCFVFSFARAFSTIQGMV